MKKIEINKTEILKKIDNMKNIKKNKLIIAGILSVVILIAIFSMIMVEKHDDNKKRGNDVHGHSWNEKNNDGHHNDDDKEMKPFAWYDEKMAEHCMMMPKMNGCEKYVEYAKNNQKSWMDISSNNMMMWNDWMKMWKWMKMKDGMMMWEWMKMWEEVEESSIMKNEPGLMQAKKVEVVELKDGDTYTMEVTKVIKEIWNDTVVMLAYNGSIPGPVIKVAKNSRITLKFINSVKDLKTTLHSHGLRLDYKMDGVPDTMWGEQVEMGYWDTFEYVLDFPDEGVYWYHPHVREDLQQELGLYGNYIVTPTETDYWSNVNREETLILDDILMENDKIAPISDSFANYVLMGRYGNTMLVNWDTNYNLDVKKWESIRMYFTNVANTRVFQVAIPWAKMKLVWWDIWKYEKEVMIDSFVMAPAERYIVDVYFENSWKFDILNKNPEFTKLLGTITVSEEEISESFKSEFDTLRVNQDVISDIDNFRKYFDTAPDKYLNLSVSMNEMDMGMEMWEEVDDDLIEWLDNMNQMNKMSSTETLAWKLIDKENGKEGMDINWKFKVWDKVKIRIYNDPESMHPMQHPMHFHGQRFLVVSENGVTPDNMVWKDTVLVKTWEYVDILIDITNPWIWMSHCHVAEHLTAWMMMNFTVEK